MLTRTTLGNFGTLIPTVLLKWYLPEIFGSAILELRMQTGEPYIVFIDAANRALPSWLSDKGLKFTAPIFVQKSFCRQAKKELPFAAFLP